MALARADSTPGAPVPNPAKPSDSNQKMVDAISQSIKRRVIVGSLNIGIATAKLVAAIIKNGKYTSVEDLIALIKRAGKQLTAANPKELACANIIRRTLKLIREEYRAAAAAHLSAPPSAPETPYFGPTTPGIHPPANHYLSNDLAFIASNPGSGSGSAAGSPGTSQANSPAPSRPGLAHTQTSLSNFVAMRHSRAQHHIERTGSVAGAGLGGLGMTMAGLAIQTPMRESSLDLSGSGNMLGSRHGSIDEGMTPGLGTYSPQPTPGRVTMSTNAQQKYDSEEFARQSAKLRPVLLQAIEEVIGELETTHEDVARGAKEHIHPGEVILTMGYSKTVEHFLKQAAKDRNFQVIVAETSTLNLGADLADSLSTAGIDTILVPDSSIFALIPRITKLVLGCHTVLANGGLFGIAGSLSAALAAHSHAKPVIIATGQYKFAPAWNTHREHGAVDYQSPAEALGVSAPGPNDGEENETIVSYWDYVRPELVDLYVTNEGDHSASYIYRLIKDSYDDEDQEL